MHACVHRVHVCVCSTKKQKAKTNTQVALQYIKDFFKVYFNDILNKALKIVGVYLLNIYNRRSYGNHTLLCDCSNFGMDLAEGFDSLPGEGGDAASGDAAEDGGDEEGDVAVALDVIADVGGGDEGDVAVALDVIPDVGGGEEGDEGDAAVALNVIPDIGRRRVGRLRGLKRARKARFEQRLAMRTRPILEKYDAVRKVFYFIYYYYYMLLLPH